MHCMSRVKEKKGLRMPEMRGAITCRRVGRRLPGKVTSELSQRMFVFVQMERKRKDLLC